MKPFFNVILYYSIFYVEFIIENYILFFHIIRHRKPDEYGPPPPPIQNSDFDFKWVPAMSCIVMWYRGVANYITNLKQNNSKNKGYRMKCFPNSDSTEKIQYMAIFNPFSHSGHPPQKKKKNYEKRNSWWKGLKDIKTHEPINCKFSKNALTLLISQIVFIQRTLTL